MLRYFVHVFSFQPILFKLCIRDLLLLVGFLVIINFKYTTFNEVEKVVFV